MTKRKMSKLSTKKLEDRIAPAIIGGVLEGTDTTIDASCEPIQASSEPDIQSPTDTIHSDTYTDAPVGSADDGLGFNNFPPESPMYNGFPECAEITDDGGMNLAPPDGIMSLDFANQELTFDNSSANAIMPEYMSVQPDGGISMDLPMGSDFNPESNELTVPNAGVDQFIPPSVDIAPDGAVSVAIDTENVTIDQTEGLMKIDPVAANDYLPPDMTITPDGGVEFIPPQGASFDIDNNQLIVPGNNVGELIPHDMTIKPDGGLDIKLPEGIQYNPVDHALTFTSNTTDFAPQQNDPYFKDAITVNSDGSLVVKMPETFQYADGIVSVPQDMTYTVMQGGVSTTPDGAVAFTMPPGTDYSNGSVYVPHASADYMMHGNVHIDASGGLAIDLPKDCSFPDSQHITLPPENAGFALSPGFTIDSTGALNMQMPPAVSYTDGQLYLPPESAPWACGPDYQFKPDGSMIYHTPGETYMPSPGIAYMPPHTAMDYSMPGAYGCGAPTGYGEGGLGYGGGFGYGTTPWAEPPAMPDTAHYLPGIGMSYPIHGDMYFNEGSSLLAMDHTAANNWMPEHYNLNPDGSMNIGLPEGTQYNGDENSLRVDYNSVNNFTPDYMHINPDGSMGIQCPPSITYDPAMNSIYMPYPGDPVSMEPPYVPHGDGVCNFVLHLETAPQPDGSIDFKGAAPDMFTFSTTIPDGAADPAFSQPGAGVLTISPNYAQFIDTELTNHFPPHIENADGSISIAVPSGVSLTDDGSLNVNKDAMSTGFNGKDFIFTIHDSHSEGIGTSYVEAGVHVAPAPMPHCMPTPYMPPEMGVYPNGSIGFTLPAEATIHPAGDGIILPNTYMNDKLPEFMNINPDGSMNVKLPENIGYDSQQGTISFPPPIAHMAPPPYDPNVSFSSDGALVYKMPLGMQVDPASGMATVPCNMTNIFMPDGMQTTPDGQVIMKMPDGAMYNPASSLVIIPHSYADTFTPPDVTVGGNGSIAVNLPEGCKYDPAMNVINVPSAQTAWALPTDIKVDTSGSLEYKMPESFSYANNTLSIPAPEANWAIHPDYKMMPDGGMAYQVSQGGISIDGNQLSMDQQAVNNFAMPGDNGMGFSSNYLGSSAFTCTSWDCTPHQPPMDAYEQHYITPYYPSGAHFYPDGSCGYTPPQGVDYNPDSSMLTYKPEYIHTYLPEPYNITADGGITIDMPQGTQYDPMHQTITFDPASCNNLSNYIGPDCAVTPEGNLQWDAHPNMEYNPAMHTISVPYDSCGTILPDYMSIDNGGNVHVAIPDGAVMNPDNGTIAFPAGASYQILPPELTVHDNGTLQIQMPPETSFDIENKAVTIPPAHNTFAPPPETPGVHYNQDGSVQVKLPEGTNFDPNAGVVSIPQPMTSAVLPEGISTTPDGMIEVKLPEGTQFYPETGGITVPQEHSMYVLNAGIQTDQFGNIQMQLPPESNWDPAAGAVTFAPTEAPYMLNSGITMTTDGLINCQLPEMASFTDGTMYIPPAHLDYALPPDVNISLMGNLEVQMPYDTILKPDGTLVIPPESSENIPQPNIGIGYNTGAGYTGYGDGGFGYTV
jgi:hypothetical protein